MSTLPELFKTSHSVTLAPKPSKQGGIFTLYLPKKAQFHI